MNLLDDPSMKEIVIDFCDETISLIEQLEESLGKLEDDPALLSELENYGQIIDRIMGAAKSVGADEVAKFCELGKLIGYKSSQTKDDALINVVTAVLFDTTDLLGKMVGKIKTGDSTPLEGLNTEAFGTRLSWLSDKFKDIERSSCDYGNENLDQDSIDDLMKTLGL